MFQNDWMMRQIDEITRFLARVILNKETTIYSVILDEDGNCTDAGELYLRLKVLIKQGQINSAENLLFERIENGYDMEYFEIAIDFYSQVNELDDERLAECNFTREEIKEGLLEVKNMYNIQELPIEI